jgi:hypothetical protein
MSQLRGMPSCAFKRMMAASSVRAAATAKSTETLGVANLARRAAQKHASQTCRRCKSRGLLEQVQRIVLHSAQQV